ncbi:MAG: XRE family transcriptional regulator [Alphaproteobacteria bacterium]|nr:MAG: XRE family transcriptional regulator [Alphaproteobacteria bacterium]
MSEEKKVFRGGRGRTGEPESEKRRLQKIDVHVGSRIRLKRTLLGLSQEKLGEMLGLTFQQVQKYERGANRVGAARLFKLSEVMEVPVSFFFDDMPADLRIKKAGLSEEGAGFDGELSRREILELARAFDRIDDERVRRRVVDLTKSLANYTMPDPSVER